VARKPCFLDNKLINNMKKLLAFHTNLMAFDYYRFPDPPYKGKGWHFDLVLSATELPIGSAVVDDKIYPAKEVMIWADNEVFAQRAADLTHAARLLVEGSNLLSHLYPGEHAPIHRANPKFASMLTEDESQFLSRTRVMTPDIPLACRIAARASLRLQYVYALAKLRLSLETFSVPVIELDPYHSANVPKSPLPEDHVRIAFAILAAWSCVEELGFEIRASSIKPSKLPDGSWNPIVQQELEGRLRRGHINLKESFHWSLRGPKTGIEKKRAPNIIQKAPWARYQVRDGKIEVIDAIHYVSFLRSWIAAHKTDKRLLRVLSVYEVSNAQFLARRLLMEKMGLWRDFGNDPSGD
jgi:hypothetical protein